MHGAKLVTICMKAHFTIPYVWIFHQKQQQASRLIHGKVSGLREGGRSRWARAKDLERCGGISPHLTNARRPRQHSQRLHQRDIAHALAVEGHDRHRGHGHQNIYDECTGARHKAASHCHAVAKLYWTTPVKGKLTHCLQAQPVLKCETQREPG
jgi:hypothetical protein